MAQNRPTLAVEERSERGSRSTRRLRREGFVPGIIYGGGDDPVTFKVPERELRRVLHDGSALLDLEIAGTKPRPAIIKEQQFHPVRGEVTHIDLLQVRLDEKIHSTVSVELEGVENSPGVRDGGVLEQPTRELNIEALPTDIPESIVVDVSGLEMNTNLTLSEVTAPAGVELLDDPDETVIATVSVPSKVEEPEVEVETELIGEDGEPVEGAADEGGEDSSASEDGDSGDSGGDDS